MVFVDSSGTDLFFFFPYYKDKDMELLMEETLILKMHWVLEMEGLLQVQEDHLLLQKGYSMLDRRVRF